MAENVVGIIYNINMNSNFFTCIMFVKFERKNQIQEQFKLRYLL